MDIAVHTAPWAVTTAPRGQRWAAVGEQKGSFFGRQAVDQIVPLHCTENEHFQCACEFAKKGIFPMDEEPAADHDLRCAAYHIIKNIEKLDTARDQWYKPVKELSERLMPLTKCLHRHQSATAKAVAGQFHLAFLAVAILLIGWLD